MPRLDSRADIAGRVPWGSRPTGVPPRRPSPERRALWQRRIIEQRARDHFEALPGMCLTQCQAVRLFGLPPDASRRVLELLMREGLVLETADGHYVNRRTRELLELV